MYFDKIAECVAEKFDCQIDEIKMDTNIFEDLGADSLDIVDLLMSLEDLFGITIPDEDAMEIKTVGDMVNYIEAHSDVNLEDDQ